MKMRQVLCISALAHKIFLFNLHHTDTTYHYKATWSIEILSFRAGARCRKFGKILQVLQVNLQLTCFVHVIEGLEATEWVFNLRKCMTTPC